MKIKCEFCGTMMDDTQSACPSCGAPNKNVRRSTGDQPLTVEELLQWYADKGLPPEEVTRFFIGKDVREPKAFGIYYEEDTENYVVYKNKASGERSIRYRGTDQAYAVNELFQRLKQEIIQQKMLNVKKRQAGTDAQQSKAGKRAKGCLGNLLMIAGIIGAIAVCFTVFLTVFGLILTRNDPLEGLQQYRLLLQRRELQRPELVPLQCGPKELAGAFEPGPCSGCTGDAQGIQALLPSGEMVAGAALSQFPGQCLCPGYPGGGDEPSPAITIAAPAIITI